MLHWLRTLLERKPRYANDQFEQAVRQSFAFLVKEYGFHEMPPRTEGYATWIEYEKPAAKVTVYREVGSGIHVSLESPSTIEPGLRRDFGLH